ncbi:unnamed protein product [Amoebophrya sp. A120]|nr:unnamed protein product [Amoebophrya sp. A120]|eukprot:GSA120T00026062001.1
MYNLQQNRTGGAPAAGLQFRPVLLPTTETPNQRITRLEQRMVTAENRVTNVEGSVVGLSNRMNTVENRVDKAEGKIGILEIAAEETKIALEADEYKEIAAQLTSLRSRYFAGPVFAEMQEALENAFDMPWTTENIRDLLPRKFSRETAPDCINDGSESLPEQKQALHVWKEYVLESKSACDKILFDQSIAMSETEIKALQMCSDLIGDFCDGLQIKTGDSKNLTINQHETKTTADCGPASPPDAPSA